MQSIDVLQGRDDEIEEVIASILAGDSRAVLTLYELTVGAVHKRARELCHDETQCVRAVQAVYMGVPRNIANFDPSRGGITAWLVERVERMVAPLSSKRLPSRATGILESRPSHVRPGSTVHLALQHLTPLHRKLVELAFLERMSTAQMAELLNMPEASIAFHLRRARALLHSELAAELFHDSVQATA